jgi:integrase
MLNHASADDLPLLPFLVLGLFCGVRPDGELQKLEWSDIDLNDKVVTIRPEVSKTNRRPIRQTLPTRNNARLRNFFYKHRREVYARLKLG